LTSSLCLLFLCLSSPLQVTFLRLLNKNLLRDARVLRLLPELLRSFALSSGTLRLMTHMRNPAPLHVLLGVFVDPAHLGMRTLWGMRWREPKLLIG
jgi:hypothetical protein